jgi:hypothetical protein
LFTFTAKSIKNVHFVSSERKEYIFVFTLKFLERKNERKNMKNRVNQQKNQNYQKSIKYVLKSTVLH